MRTPVFAVLTACLCMGISACGGNGGSDASGPADMSSDCASRCGAVATKCGYAASQCSLICPGAPDAQLTCIEMAGCSMTAFKACLNSMQPGDMASSGTGDMAHMCIALTQTGCNSLNNPSNCCTDAIHTAVVCNGNSDGQGNSQCCVNLGNPCTQASDCCGHAASASMLVRCCPNGKCSDAFGQCP
jgi:hypothetical protein